MTESFPHFGPSTQRDERLKKHFLNSHISVESEKCDKREASDEEETFPFESKSGENSKRGQALRVSGPETFVPVRRKSRRKSPEVSIPKFRSLTSVFDCACSAERQRRANVSIGRELKRLRLTAASDSGWADDKTFSRREHEAS